MQSTPVHSCQPGNINSRERIFFFLQKQGRNQKRKFLTKPGKFDTDGALTGYSFTGGGNLEAFKKDKENKFTSTHKPKFVLKHKHAEPKLGGVKCLSAHRR